MSYNWNRIAQLSAIGAVGSLAIWLGTTVAKEEASVLVNKPATTATPPQSGPVLPPPSNPNEQPAASATSSDPFAPPTAASKRAPLPLPPQTAQPTAPVVKRPFMRPAEPRQPAKGQLVVGEESMPAPPGTSPVVPGEAVPAPAVPGVRVEPTPPIEYDTDHDARKMYRTGKIDLVMVTKDPATDCAYAIPMCIPACCVGEPKVSGGRSLLGRGVVEYCWPCGFRAIVKFRHVLGDVKVEYEGD